MKRPDAALNHLAANVLGTYHLDRTEILDYVGYLERTVGELTGDRELIDWLARHWDSQGKGHHLMGAWIPNTTGSFRDAIRAARLAARPTEEKP